jgi:hypothetical protein|tara:strand:+ start:792 stop:1025 length:234 start_codon:yes stop_codon:yes gene_type:complete
MLIPVKEETKRVKVSAFWRMEQTKEIEIPADMELSEVRGFVTTGKFDFTDNFDARDGYGTDFDVSLVEDEEGNQWWL